MRVSIRTYLLIGWMVNIFFVSLMISLLVTHRTEELERAHQERKEARSAMLELHLELKLLQRLQEEVLMHQVKAQLEPVSLPKKSDEYKVMVDYNRSLGDLIEASRCITTFNIAEVIFLSPKLVGKKEKNFKRYHVGARISSEDMLLVMSKEGYRPASIQELLMLHEVYPCRFPTVALGSVRVDTNGNRWVVQLWNKSDIDLRRYDNSWAEYYRFLAILNE